MDTNQEDTNILEKSIINYQFEDILVSKVTYYKKSAHKHKKLPAKNLIENYSNYRYKDFCTTSTWNIIKVTDGLISDLNIGLSVFIYCFYHSRTFEGFKKKLKKFRFKTNDYQLNKIYIILREDHNNKIISKNMIFQEVPDLPNQVNCNTCLYCGVSRTSHIECNKGCMYGYDGTCKYYSYWCMNV